MRKIIVLMAAAILLSCSSRSGDVKVSIFVQHIENIARQEGISFRDAASRIRELGYTGVDVGVTIDPEELAVLDEFGFAHACAIVQMGYTSGEQPENERQALRFMQDHDYDLLLLVPGVFAPGYTDEEVSAVLERTAKFTRRADSLGFQVMVEDFDNPRSPCYNTAALDRMFGVCEGLGHVFDTGNYLYCDEDPLEALAHFRSRIMHVHLKDRLEVGGKASTAVGAGIVPMEAIIRELRGSGYDGWLTVEHFGAKQMLEYATTSIGNIREAWGKSGAAGRH